MWPVPEVLLGVLAIIIVLGYLSGQSRQGNVHSTTRLGTGQVAGANVTEQRGVDNAAGNTSGQIMSMPGTLPGIPKDSAAQSKKS